MDKKLDVLCIGLLSMDILVGPVNEKIFNCDITRVDKFDISTGGDALTEATILSRFGFKVGVIGKIGAGFFGQMLLKEARESNINVENVVIDKEADTCTTIALFNKKGDRNFITCKGGNDILSLSDINISAIRKAKIVSLGSIFGLPMLDSSSIKTIFKEARDNNAITAADVTQDLDGTGLEGIKEILEYIDIFLPSYEEAVSLTKEKEPEKAAERLMEKGAKTVVIKLGKEGCYIRTRNESYKLKAFDVKAVDTTGAGDNFVAGFLAGILNKWELEKCGMFANAVGAVSVQSAGAVTSVKSMGQILDFMNTKNIL